MSHLKVLVSTRETQGQRANDFCFVDEDEVVVTGPVCGGETPDGGCGCARSFEGIRESTGTTTFKVAFRPTTRDALINALADRKRRGGLPASREWCAEIVDDMLRIAAAFPAETILERRGDDIQPRKFSATRFRDITQDAPPVYVRFRAVEGAGDYRESKTYGPFAYAQLVGTELTVDDGCVLAFHGASSWRLVSPEAFARSRSEALSSVNIHPTDAVSTWSDVVIATTKGEKT